MVRSMTRTLALAHPLVDAAARLRLHDLARQMIVIGCAAALILAGETLPF